MRLFFIKLISLCLAIALSALAVGMFTRPEESRSLGVTIAKHRALQKIASPKIVFVGGSNVVFGIDSERVQRELGKSVFDLGLNVYFGLPFHLEEVTPYIQAGDLIVISPEYHLFYKNALKLFETDYIVPSVIHATFPASLRFFPIRQQINTLLLALNRLPSRVGDRIRGIAPGPDFTPNYNAWGDYIGHLNASAEAQKAAAEAVGQNAPQVMNWSQFEFDETSITRLDQFNIYVQSRGARVVIVLPPIPDETYARDKAFYQAHYKRLERDLSIPILSPPERYVYPKQHMFDSDYHVDAFWRQERTTRIIQDLQRMN
jgi:hypothetical protein